MTLNPGYQSRESYLVRYKGGPWELYTNTIWQSDTKWNPQYTEIIWVKTKDMKASWWIRKDGHSHKRKVDENDLALYMLQVEYRHHSLV